MMVLLAGCAPVIGDTWIRPSDSMEMFFVPAGKFTMGSDREMVNYAKEMCRQSGGADAVSICKFAAFIDEQPAHEVAVGPFWLDKMEVSNRQYRLCVSAGACDPPRLQSSFSRENYFTDPAFEDYPVINVDSTQVSDYCSWAGARLAAENEWEYAARGPESLIFPWGNTFDRTRLNYCDASCDGISDNSYNDGFPETAPVGSFPAGASWVGILDLAGNVREWVSDVYASYQTGIPVNQSGMDMDALRIPRGGSWYDKPDDVRSANRGGELPDYFRHNLGFRCAKDDP
jgi:serine/threonine-protein kinase